MKETCKTCGGTGEKIAVKAMLSMRLTSGLSQKQCAALMGITPSYLCDLENGRRDWNSELYQKLKAAVEMA